MDIAEQMLAYKSENFLVERYTSFLAKWIDIAQASPIVNAAFHSSIITSLWYCPKYLQQTWALKMEERRTLLLVKPGAKLIEECKTPGWYIVTWVARVLEV